MISFNSTTFTHYPVEFSEPLVKIRQLSLDNAKEIVPDEEMTESLKWNQPSYGSPIRIDRFGTDKLALFFHSQANLVETFRGLFVDTLEFSKNRAIVLDPNQ